MAEIKNMLKNLGVVGIATYSSGIGIYENVKLIRINYKQSFLRQKLLNLPKKIEKYWPARKERLHITEYLDNLNLLRLI